MFATITTTRPPTAHHLGWVAGGDAYRGRRVAPCPFPPGSDAEREYESAFEVGWHDERDRVSE